MTPNNNIFCLHNYLEIRRGRFYLPGSIILFIYENAFGKIQGGIEDQIWYKEYISKFKLSDYNVPSVFINDPSSWELFVKLYAGTDLFLVNKQAGILEFESNYLINEKYDSHMLYPFYSFKLKEFQVCFGMFVTEQMERQLEARSLEGKMRMMNKRIKLLEYWKNRTIYEDEDLELFNGYRMLDATNTLFNAYTESDLLAHLKN